MRNGPGWEGLDVNIGSGAFIALLVPAREGGEKDEGEEGENNGHDKKVWEDDSVLEGRCHPNKVERILINRKVVDKGGCVVGTDVATSISVDADTEVADAYTELRSTDNVCDR